MKQTKNTATAICPDCRQEIEGPNQAQANRTLGLHRRKVHGYHSPNYAESKAYRNRARARRNGLDLTAGKTTEDRRREYQRLYRARKKVVLEAKQKALSFAYPRFRQEEQTPAPKLTASQAEPCKLSECPVCHSKFYVVKEQKE
jgi:hypothetical protein